MASESGGEGRPGSHPRQPQGHEQEGGAQLGKDHEAQLTEYLSSSRACQGPENPIWRFLRRPVNMPIESGTLSMALQPTTR